MELFKRTCRRRWLRLNTSGRGPLSRRQRCRRERRDPAVEPERADCSTYCCSSVAPHTRVRRPRQSLTRRVFLCNSGLQRGSYDEPSLFGERRAHCGRHSTQPGVSRCLSTVWPIIQVPFIIADRYPPDMSVRHVAVPVGVAPSQQTADPLVMPLSDTGVPIHLAINRY